MLDPEIQIPGGGEGSGVLGQTATQGLSDAAAKKSGRKAAPSSGVRKKRETRARLDAGPADGIPHSGDAHVVSDAVGRCFSDPLVQEISSLHRQRRRWLKARNALILQGKAACRSFCHGDKKAGNAAFARIVAGEARDDDFALTLVLAPFLPAIARFDEELKPIEKALEKRASKLPVASFINDVRGVAIGSLAAIVGEAGDLSEYKSIMAVWKRFGMAVIDGERQRKCADPEKALRHNYFPERRSIMWNIGNGLIGAMGRGRRPFVGEDISLRTDWSPYERLFVERLRIEAEKDP
ncbi:hypothetical protein ACRC7T_06395 [Segnochrobactraceae bacterium EtOH-i3]